MDEGWSWKWNWNNHGFGWGGALWEFEREENTSRGVLSAEFGGDWWLQKVRGGGGGAIGDESTLLFDNGGNRG